MAPAEDAREGVEAAAEHMAAVVEHVRSLGEKSTRAIMKAAVAPHVKAVKGDTPRKAIDTTASDRDNMARESEGRSVEYRR
jgi:hypothetical protein